MGSEPRDPPEADPDPEIEVEPDAENEEEEADTSHLDGAADGCGCTEMWEHLADQRGE